MAANHVTHISAATSTNGKVYMWGMCRGQSVLVPTETRFGELDQVFSSFSSPACSWRLVSFVGESRQTARCIHTLCDAFPLKLLESKETSNLVNCIEERFDDIVSSACDYVMMT